MQLIIKWLFLLLIINRTTIPNRIFAKFLSFYTDIVTINSSCNMELDDHLSPFQPKQFFIKMHGLTELCQTSVMFNTIFPLSETMFFPGELSFASEIISRDPSAKVLKGYFLILCNGKSEAAPTFLSQVCNAVLVID